MYMDDNSIRSRERISDDMLRQMLGENEPSEEASPRSNPMQRQNLTLPDSFPLASVYAPTQEFRRLYDYDTALSNGTIFEELNLPFMGMSVTKGGPCRG